MHTEVIRSAEAAAERTWSRTSRLLVARMAGVAPPSPTSLATGTPQAFTQALTRTDALYFVVTVFATVGFGDIAPVSEVARVVLTVQMVCDLPFLGVVVRAMLLGVQRADARKRPDLVPHDPPVT